jgi:hypothetical protein
MQLELVTFSAYIFLWYIYAWRIGKILHVKGLWKSVALPPTVFTGNNILFVISQITVLPNSVKTAVYASYSLFLFPLYRDKADDTAKVWTLSRASQTR